MDQWDRQDQEPVKAFAALVQYINMGPARSIAQLAGNIGKSESHLRALSATWNWVARAAAYDHEQSKLELAAIKVAHLADIAAHRERTKIIAQQQLDAGHRFLTLALDRLNEMTATDLADLSGAELATAMKAVSIMQSNAMTAIGQSLCIAELLTALRQTNPNLI